MKTLKYLFSGALILTLSFFVSCEKTNEVEKGKLEFSFRAEDNSLKSGTEIQNDTADNYYSYHLMVSVKNEAGEYVMEDEIIPLLGFGDGFVSGKIEIEAGSYRLMKFMVIGPDGQVQYASPVEGSPKAYLVDDPLPMNFKISPGDITRLIPQVLPVRGSLPADFGYMAFGFEVVDPLVAYIVVINDNPLRFGPTAMIPAKLSVLNPNGEMIEYRLQAKINRIMLKPGPERYFMIVENPNYPPLEIEVSARDLYRSSEENPYIFRLGENPQNTLIIQPGPEEGKDATITDLNPGKNLGDYEYFEASFLTEPIITVMRTKRSLIQFDLSEVPDYTRIESVHLVLHFEYPLWDSLYNSELDDYMTWDNRLVFRQIIEPWEEYDVTWENQPATIEANQVFVPQEPQLSTNGRKYDVTSLFIPIQEIAAPNHGFMFMHPTDENKYPGGMKFASSDYPIPEMRPKLIVKYSYLPD